eukprot:Gb_20567 [translate_table: standard]
MRAGLCPHLLPVPPPPCFHLVQRSAESRGQGQGGTGRGRDRITLDARKLKEVVDGYVEMSDRGLGTISNDLVVVIVQAMFHSNGSGESYVPSHRLTDSVSAASIEEASYLHRLRDWCNQRDLNF